MLNKLFTFRKTKVIEHCLKFQSFLFLFIINNFNLKRFWYGIPPNEEHKFFDLAKKLYPEANKECSEFMRHKTFLFNPLLALSKGIKVHKCLQNPGEFVITLAKSYHAGFNMGFNCAEAVNFATKSWINLGMKAKSCDCQSGSVKVDMNYFMRNLVKKNKIDKKEIKSLDEDDKLFSKPKKTKNINSNSKTKKTNYILEINEASKKNENLLLKRKRKSNSNNKSNTNCSRRKKI